MRSTITFFITILASVCLSAQTTCSTSFTHVVNSSNNGRVDFSISANSSPASSGYRHRYTLSYGDGSASNTFTTHQNVPLGNIIYTYQSSGSYSVLLTMELVDSVTNNVLCTSTYADSVTVTVYPSCYVDYSYLLQSSGSNTVNFQNSSSGSSGSFIQAYVWEFGDGSTSTQTNPSHTYASPGVYNVYLKAYLRQFGQLICRDSVQKVVQVGKMDSCGAYFLHSAKSNFKEIEFYNISQIISYATQFTDVSAEWYFGDGASSSQEHPTHTYSQAGTYQVTLIMYGRDSLTQAILCTDTTVKSINVAPPSPNCRASYYLDSLNSSAVNLNIYNNSTPTLNNPAYTVSYLWDFGDGSTSNQAFPTHTYQSSGAYNVCLTVNVVDTNNQTCTDTYCRQIGVDSLGNIIFKNSSTGFTLNVLDPNTVGQEEFKITELEVYPNPANREINIAGLAAKADWKLIDMSGTIIAQGDVESGNSALDVSGYAAGLYILRISNESMQSNIKLQIVQ